MKLVSAEVDFLMPVKLDMCLVMDNSDSYYMNINEPSRSCLLTLRKIIREQDNNITETQKWGMPSFCFKKRVFCYLWTDKKTNEPYILFVEGKYLEHAQLEKGNRAKMKIFRVDPNEDIPIDTIKLLLSKALELYL